MESTEEKDMQKIRDTTQAPPNNLFLVLDKLYREVQQICTDIKGPLIKNELLLLIIHCGDETLLTELLNDSQKGNFILIKAMRKIMKEFVETTSAKDCQPLIPLINQLKTKYSCTRHMSSKYECYKVDSIS